MKKSPPAPNVLSRDWKAGVRCWIEHDGKVVLGKGRVDLLEHIDRSHSIRAAARDLGMSYRRAWLLVQSANEGAGEPLVTTATGGKQGGGASLTPRGRELIALFRRLDKTLREVAEATLLSFLADNASSRKEKKETARSKSAVSRRTAKNSRAE